LTFPTRDMHETRVRDLAAIGRDSWRLTVTLDARFETSLEGGHFFMLRAAGAEFPFLNRPFSVHAAGADGRGPDLAFLFKTVGRGTRCLARLSPGDPVTLIGPLGQPFPDPRDDETTILVAGGVGLPPLHLWLQRRRQRGARGAALLLYGARSSDQLLDLESAGSLGVEVRTATEDGSHGMRGRVDRLLEAALDGQAGKARLLTCGPDPMMRAVSRIAEARGVPCLVSLETLMACGFGVCNACAVPIADAEGRLARYARACIDGPVMDGRSVLWQHAAH
jgi:dihydroorotate dehydrogenase electron transfer subunit